MKISFHGAAGTVTGSKHMLELEDGRKILLDCGMFQGLGEKTDELNEHFGFRPDSIDVLLLSHAHIDHTGLIPRLVKEGFKGKIFCTEPTKDLTDILLHDSAEIQTYEIDFINKKREKQGKAPYEALYTPEDVDETMMLFEIIEYNHWFDVIPGVQAYYTNAGHLVGSAAITVKVNEGGKETVIAYSGDVGRYRSVLLQPPAEFPQADYIILESTYGDSHHDIKFNIIKTMNEWIQKTCVEKKGKLVIPAFSVGRTQEILYALNQLELERRLPEISFFVDSPLSLKATEVIKKYKDHFNERLQQVLAIDDDPFHFNGLKYVEKAEDSKKLVEYEEPCVIISASGTGDAGRVRHHIHRCVDEDCNAIIMAGYCSHQSLGGQLLSGKEEVELFGEELKVAAEIGKIAGMSAHGDSDDLVQFLSCQDAAKVKGVFLVHGEPDVQKRFSDRLEIKGFKNIQVPAQHQQFEV